MKKTITLIIALILLVVGGILGYNSWQNHKDSSSKAKTQTTTTAQQGSDQNLSTEKSSSLSKIPASWVEYDSSENGLRVGYPQEWGALDRTSLTTPEYKDDAKNLQGRFTISYAKKEGFAITAHKYGATIRPVADSNSWVVSQENPAAADGYKVGETYKATTREVEGGTVLDLPLKDEGCTYPRWVVELENSYATITLPGLCSSGYVGAAIPETNVAAYETVKVGILESLTLY